MGAPAHREAHELAFVLDTLWDAQYDELSVWKLIGAAGVTPVSLVAGYVQYDLTDWGPAQYRLVGDEVQLRGSVKLGSGATPGVGATPILFEPDWRPDRHTTFPHVNTTLATGYAYIVRTTGLLTLAVASNSNWVPLDHIRFSLANAAIA